MIAVRPAQRYDGRRCDGPSRPGFQLGVLHQISAAVVDERAGGSAMIPGRDGFLAVLSVASQADVCRQGPTDVAVQLDGPISALYLQLQLTDRNSCRLVNNPPRLL